MPCAASQAIASGPTSPESCLARILTVYSGRPAIVPGIAPENDSVLPSCAIAWLISATEGMPDACLASVASFAPAAVT